MAELVAATGVSRYGFYTEFGDKHDLFLRCVDHYASTTIEMALSPLERTDSGLAQIHGYFAQFLNALHSDEPNMGCLIGNTAMSSAAWDTAVYGRVQNHFTRMRAAFHNALQNAVHSGDLAADEDVDALADYLVGVATGYLACLRSMEPDAVRHYIEVALERLQPA